MLKTVSFSITMIYEASLTLRSNLCSYDMLAEAIISSHPRERMDIEREESRRQLIIDNCGNLCVFVYTTFITKSLPSKKCTHPKQREDAIGLTLKAHFRSVLM